MALRRLALAFVAVVVALPAAHAGAADLLDAGTYEQINPATKRVMNPGNQIVFVRGKRGSLAFSVNAVRGIDLNQGYVVGTLPASGPSVTWMQKGGGTDCKITFTALANHGLKVVQDSKVGDCGFGYGVLADGTYVRTRADGPLGKPLGP